MNRFCSHCKIEKPLTSDYWHKDKRKKHGFVYICKDCRGNERRKNPKKPKTKLGFKICSKCKEELPATFNYFYKDSKTKDSLYPSCKFCLSKTPLSRKEGFKICIRCLRELPKARQYFSKNASSSDGFLGYCKECQGRSFTTKQKYLTSSEKEGFKKCSHCGNELLKDEEHFYKSKVSPDGFLHKCKTCIRNYRKEHKEEIRQTYRLYRQRNKDKFNIRKQKRKMIKKCLESNFSTKDWKDCLEHFNNRCAYCGEKSNSLQQEHFIPVAKNGPYTKKNIIPACHSCNSSKKDTDFFDWYPKHRDYSKDKEIKILKYLGL